MKQDETHLLKPGELVFCDYQKILFGSLDESCEDHSKIARYIFLGRKKIDSVRKDVNLVYSLELKKVCWLFDSDILLTKLSPTLTKKGKNVS